MLAHKSSHRCLYSPPPPTLITFLPLQIKVHFMKSTFGMMHEILSRYGFLGFEVNVGISKGKKKQTQQELSKQKKNRHKKRTTKSRSGFSRTNIPILDIQYTKMSNSNGSSPKVSPVNFSNDAWLVSRGQFWQTGLWVSMNLYNYWPHVDSDTLPIFFPTESLLVTVFTPLLSKGWNLPP